MIKLPRLGLVAASGVGLPVLLFAASCGGAPTPDTTAKVDQVIQRSRTTHETYSLYNWYRITRPGQAPVEEWAAEFHLGGKHRVETPRDRVVADCDTKIGSALSLVTGKVVEGPQVAAAACGIDGNAKVVREEWQGVVQTSHGAADRIRLIDDDVVRTYEVLPNGALIRSTYSRNVQGEPALLETLGADLLSTVPSPDMFDRASLQKSFVPPRFTHKHAD